MGQSELIQDKSANFLEFPNETYESALKEIISENLGDPSRYLIECTAGSKKGDNYLGIVYQIKIKCKSDNSVKLSLILKSAPQNPARRDQFQIPNVFARESSFYDEIYPIFEEFQREKGIDVEQEGFHHKAKIFKIIKEEPSEGLFFEDLKVKGFDMFDRHKDLTSEHVFLTMKALAKLHALSFALRDQKPEVIKKFHSMDDLFFKFIRDEESSIRAWVISESEKSLQIVEKLENEEIKEKVREILKNPISQFEELLSGERAEPHSVVCHGDCWNNNIMYLNDKNQLPIDIKFLDFQIMRYASPVLDLAYYIFGCTVKELRDKHLHEFLNVYYNTLSQFLIKLGSSPDKLFSRQDFDNAWKKFGKFAITMGVLIVPFFIAESDEAPDMDEMAMKFKEADGDPSKEVEFISLTSETSKQKYESRLKGIFQDVYDMGWI